VNTRKHEIPLQRTLPLCETIRIWKSGMRSSLSEHDERASERYGIVPHPISAGKLTGVSEHVDPFGFVSHGRSTELRPGYGCFQSRK
jgi:hypothetical protein